MNILFVCTVNRLRSRTAQEHYSKKYKKHNFLSCGTDIEFILDWNKKRKKEILTPITEELVKWADIIYCMEHHHKREVQKINSEANIEILDIPDIYDYMDPELITTLGKKIIL